MDPVRSSVNTELSCLFDILALSEASLKVSPSLLEQGGPCPELLVGPLSKAID